MIFLIGYPKHIGGANTEAWHTLKLWRSYGIDVTVIPTWPRDHPSPDPWRERLRSIGIPVVLTEPDDLHRVPGLPDSPVVSFCNTRFLEHASKFQGLACPIVWVGCMCWTYAQERMHYQKNDLFERYVFQSQYQRDQVEPQLAKAGYTPDLGTIIRGAFDPQEFALQPKDHDPGSRFYVGRLSRNGIDKFPADLFAQYARIPHPTSARILGWSAEIEEKLGAPPKWAETLKESTETAQSFLKSIHCLIPGIGCCRENWPRVGLEAMAAGVPIIAENAGGWKEMLRGGGIAGGFHGRTGVPGGYIGLRSATPNGADLPTVRLAESDHRSRYDRKPMEDAVREPVKALFIAIPRTGSMSMIEALGRGGIESVNLHDNGHFPCDMDVTRRIVTFNHASIGSLLDFGVITPEWLADRWAFCVVRNPWDRLVSLYHYLWDRLSGRYQDYTPLTFPRFVEQVTSGDNDPIGLYNWRGLSMTSPQSDWIDEVPGIHIYRFENLPTCWELIKENLGSTGELLHTNSTVHKRYAAYYNGPTIRAVGKYYTVDIERFGYRFGD